MPGLLQSVNMDSPPIEFAIPEYCSHYKPMLVDEFTFNQNPLQLHYGKCAVIGRTLRRQDSNRMYLSSIRLVGLSRYDTYCKKTI